MLTQVPGHQKVIDAIALTLESDKLHAENQDETVKLSLTVSTTDDSSAVGVKFPAHVNSMHPQQKAELLAQSKTDLPMTGNETAQNQSKTPSKAENPSRTPDAVPSKTAPPAPKSVLPFENNDTLVTESYQVHDSGISRSHTDSIILPVDHLQIEKNDHDDRHPVMHSQLPVPQQYNSKRSKENRRNQCPQQSHSKNLQTECKKPNFDGHVPLVKDKTCLLWVQGKCSLGDTCSYLHQCVNDDSSVMSTEVAGHKNEKVVDSDTMHTGSKDETVKVGDCDNGELFDSVSSPAGIPVTAQVNSVDPQQKDELLVQSEANIQGMGDQTAENQCGISSKTIRKDTIFQSDEGHVSKQRRPGDSSSHPIILPEDHLQIEKNEYDNKDPVLQSKSPEQIILKRAKRARARQRKLQKKAMMACEVDSKQKIFSSTNCNSDQLVSPKEICQLWLEGKCKNGDKCCSLHQSVVGGSLTMLTQVSGHQKIVDAVAFTLESEKPYAGNQDETVKFFPTVSTPAGLPVTGESSVVGVEFAAHVNSMDPQQKKELLAESKSNLQMSGKETAENPSKTLSKIVRKEPDTQTSKSGAPKKMRRAHPQNQSISVTTENPSSSRSADDVLSKPAPSATKSLFPCEKMRPAQLQNQSISVTTANTSSRSADVLSKPAPPAPKSLFPCEKDGMLITDSDRVQDRGITQIHTDSIILYEDQVQIEKKEKDNRYPVVHSESPQQNNIKRSKKKLAPQRKLPNKTVKACESDSKQPIFSSTGCNSNHLISPKASYRFCLEGKCENGDKCWLLHQSVIGDSPTILTQHPGHQKVVDASDFALESEKLCAGNQDETVKFVPTVSTPAGLPVTGDSLVVSVVVADVNLMEPQQKAGLDARSKANLQMSGTETAENQSKAPFKTARKVPDTQTDKSPASKKMRPAQIENQSTSVTTEDPSASSSADDVPSKPAPPACEKEGMLITESDKVQDRVLSQAHTYSIILPEDQVGIEKNKHDNRHLLPVIDTQCPQQNNVKRSQGARQKSSCVSNQLVSPKPQDKPCVFPTVSSFAELSMTLSKTIRKEPDSQADESPASKKGRMVDNCAWLQSPSCSCLGFFEKDGTKITESNRLQDHRISQISNDCVNQGQIGKNKHDNIGDCLEKTLLQAIQLARVQNTHVSNEARELSELRLRVENFEAEKAELEKNLKAEFAAQLKLKDEINRETFQAALAKEMAEYRAHLRAEGFNVTSLPPATEDGVATNSELGLMQICQ